MFDKSILKNILSNEIVSISFKKANGKDRKIVCRIPSSDKFFSGGELKGNRDHLLEVIDLTLLKKNKDNPRKAWRSINLNTIFSIRMRGKEWVK
tara:strand:+ start:114 stop:395 length:282 start_codon:yes stop_codon:yes gene_type:complete